MRLRARSIKGVKVNNKRSFTNLECRYCKEGGQETQEHIEECSGCNYERSGLDMSRWDGDVLEENDRQASCYCCSRARWLDAGV